jgi:hypothetical protein
MVAGSVTRDGAWPAARRPSRLVPPLVSRARLLPLALLGLLAAAVPAAAQEPAAAAAAEARAAVGGWNAEAALALVRLGRERRREPLIDDALRNYRATADGFIYFLLDREGLDEPVLLRADQVALELFWAPPDRTRHLIHGMRREQRLPIRDFHYYLDRFTVIQNGFGDEIRVGGGQDVHGVPHPLAPGAEAHYDYLLADSTAIRLPGRPEPIRIQEVRVRPRDPTRPGFVGSVYLEPTTGDLVRLAFTFTRASYIDRRNDRVDIVLEHALWEGRYWLPREQRLVVRRELPELDLGAGTVIRAVLTVRDYDFNTPLPDAFFAGPPVVLRGSREHVAAYPFREELLAGLEAAGVVGTGDATGLPRPEELAAELLRRQYLGGLPPLRFYTPGASALLRYNRTEGVAAGAGAAYREGAATLRAFVGHAFGPDRVRAEVGATILGPPAGLHLDAYLNRPRDPGPFQGEAGVLNSLAAALFSRDYQDAFHVSGGELAVRPGGEPGRAGVRLGVVAERHTPLAVHAGGRSADFRPVLPVDAGTYLALRAVADRSRPLPTATGTAAATLRVEADAGRWQGDAAARTHAILEATWRAPELRGGADLRLAGGLATGALPPQHLFHLGGRNTLPGHPFRAYAGSRFALAGFEGWRPIAGSLLQFRALAGAGWAAGGAGTAPATGSTGDGARPHSTGGLRGYVGVGLGIADGIGRLDFAMPFPGGPRAGRWLFTITPRLWPIL